MDVRTVMAERLLSGKIINTNYVHIITAPWLRQGLDMYANIILRRCALCTGEESLYCLVRPFPFKARR
jgi:hypothetical protein